MFPLGFLKSCFHSFSMFSLAPFTRKHALFGQAMKCSLPFKLKEILNSATSFLLFFLFLIPLLFNTFHHVWRVFKSTFCSSCRGLFNWLRATAHRWGLACTSQQLLLGQQRNICRLTICQFLAKSVYVLGVVCNTNILLLLIVLRLFHIMVFLFWRPQGMFQQEINHNRLFYCLCWMFTLGNYCCFDLQGETVRVVMKTYRFWYVLKAMRVFALQKHSKYEWNVTQFNLTMLQKMEG